MHLEALNVFVFILLISTLHIPSLISTLHIPRSHAFHAPQPIVVMSRFSVGVSPKDMTPELLHTSKIMRGHG